MNQEKERNETIGRKKKKLLNFLVRDKKREVSLLGL